MWFSLSALLPVCRAFVSSLPLFLALFTYAPQSEMLPLVYKWRKMCLLLEWWQPSKQTAGILPTMPTMMDNTRESSQMQICLCVKWFHLLAHCLVMSLSVLLNSPWLCSEWNSAEYALLYTVYYFLIVSETVVSYFIHYSMNSSEKTRLSLKSAPIMPFWILPFMQCVM